MRLHYVLWPVSWLLAFVIGVQLSLRARPADTGTQMRVTILGTGTPYPDARRFGSAILVEAGSKKMLFDCGRGTVTRLSETGVPVAAIRNVYLTHLHSDHVNALPDLWLTGWFLGRKEPLRVWGPSGTLPMTRSLTEAFGFDLQIRQKTEGLPPDGPEFDTHEIPEETVYDDGPVRVRVIALRRPFSGDFGRHEVLSRAYSYRKENGLLDSRRLESWRRDPYSIRPAQRSIATAEDAPVPSQRFIPAGGCLPLQRR